MNRIDVVLAVVLAAFAARGFWRGFSREFFSFIGLIGGLAVAAAGYAAAVPHVPAFVPENARPIAAFAVVFFLVSATANILGAVVHHLLGLVFLSFVNRLAGAVFGALKGAALGAIALLLIRAYSPSPDLLRELEHSRLARPLLGLAGDIREDVQERRGGEIAGAGGPRS